jgi:hypothetical protein
MQISYSDDFDIETLIRLNHAEKYWQGRATEALVAGNLPRFAIYSARARYCRDLCLQDIVF